MRSVVSAARRRVTSGDDGSILMELIVALVVFALTAMGLAAMGIATIKKTNTTRSDSTASQLLSKDMDIVRAMGAPALPETSTPVLVNTETIGGLTYKVWREVTQYAPGQGSCGVTAQTSKRVTTIVKWDERLGGAKTDKVSGEQSRIETKDLTGTTILTPVPDALIDGLGSYGVLIKDQNSKGLEGIPVNYTTGAVGTPGTQLTTNSEGCALLPNLAAGSNYNAWLGLQPTYVPLGYRHGVDPAYTWKTNSISANTAATAEFVYGKAAKLNLDVATDQQHPVPANIPFSIFNSAFPTANNAFWTGYTADTRPTTSMHVPLDLDHPMAGASSTFPHLFPSTLGYTPWLGTCADSDPGASSGLRGDNVKVLPGGTHSGDANVVKVDLTLNGLRTTAGLSVVAQHDDAVSPCPTAPGQSYRIAPSNAVVATPTGTTQVVRFALPFGAWKIKVVNDGRTVEAARKWDASVVGTTTQAITLNLVP